MEVQKLARQLSPMQVSAWEGRDGAATGQATVHLDASLLLIGPTATEAIF